MSSSIRMVIRVLPDGARRTAPRRPYLKSYCFFISYPRSDGARVASPFSRRSVVDDPRATCRQPPERVHSQRDEPVLRVRALIGDGDRLLVVKHRSRVGEVDAMLVQIGDGLPRIPLSPSRRPAQSLPSTSAAHSSRGKATNPAVRKVEAGGAM